MDSDGFVSCSQLDDGMDAFGDEERAPHTGMPAPTDEPQVHFVCLYGTHHGATPSFSLPATHGAKIHLGSRAPPQPRPKYATKAVVETAKAVLSDSHNHGISRTAGWLEYDQHKGVKLVNMQGAGLPMFINGVLSTVCETVLDASDGLELGFGGSESDAVTPTTVRYRAAFISMPPLVVEQTMPPPRSAPLGKRPAGGARRQAPKQWRKEESLPPLPSFASDDEQRKRST